MEKNLKKEAINFFDKVFSFRKKTLEKYLKIALGEHFSKVDKKKDIVRKHWIYLILSSWYHFLFFLLSLFLLLFSLQFSFAFFAKLPELSFSGTLFVIGLSWLLLFLVSYLSFKFKALSLFFFLFSLTLSVLNSFFLKGEILSLAGFLEFSFSTGAIFVSLFCVQLFFFFLKRLYDAYVDYKNDFIVIFEKGIYYSNKDGIFDHTHTRVEYDKITNIASKESGFIQTFFNYGFLRISTMGALDDIEFDHCARVGIYAQRLDQMRLSYIRKKEKKEKESPKGFESKLRDRVSDLLNLSD